MIGRIYLLEDQWFNNSVLVIGAVNKLVVAASQVFITWKTSDFTIVKWWWLLLSTT